MARIMHAMAVRGYLGPAGFSVANNYLSVLFEVAAVTAIAYDRELRRHIKREAVKVEDVAPLLNVLDDARASAMQRTIDRDRNSRAGKADKARQSAPAGGKNGGKGVNNSNSGHDYARNQDRGQGRPAKDTRNRGHPDTRGRQDKRPGGHQDVKVEDKAGSGGGRPYKKH